MHGNVFISLNTETYESQIPVELLERYGWEDCEEVETGETCTRIEREYLKDEEGGWLYEEVKHIDEETGEEYTTTERVYKETEVEYPCTETVCTPYHPTWEEVAGKNKSLFGEVVKVKSGVRNYYVVECMASWLKHEMSAIMALGDGLPAPQNTLLTQEEASKFINDNTQEEV